MRSFLTHFAIELRRRLRTAWRFPRRLLARFVEQDDLYSMLILSGLIGFGAALVTVAFRESIHGVQWLLTRRTGGLVETAMALPYWARIVVPAVGGLIAGGILRALNGRRRGVRPTDYMEAVAVGDGTLDARTSIVRSAASVVTIASGGSIGREGAMVQLSAIVGSRLGVDLLLSKPRRRLAVACGAAAGMAAAYNAPIAGSLFVAEIVLGSIAMESFGPMIVASVVSSVTIHSFLGYAPVFQIPALTFRSNWELIAYGIVGLAVGLLAPAFLELLRQAETLLHRWTWPAPVRLALGGLVVGVISVWFPGVWGNGYSEVTRILHGDVLGLALLAILAAKILATAATVGSGAVGGIFTPTLFVGAAGGALIGGIVHALFPHSGIEPASYALVGMGALLAATTHAPLTAILMIFEMTLDYRITLPLMLASVIAHYVAKIYRQGSSVYAHALRERVDLAGPFGDAENVSALIRHTSAGARRRGNQLQLEGSAQSGRQSHLWVVDSEDRLVGHIPSRSLRTSSIGKAHLLTVDDVESVAHVLTPETRIGHALAQFLDSRAEVLPVVRSAEDRRFLGTISRHDLLLVVQDQLATETQKKKRR